MAGKRKRGEGTVRLRKDGRWEDRVVVGYDEAGNPKTKNGLAKTKKEWRLYALHGKIVYNVNPVSCRQDKYMP